MTKSQRTITERALRKIKKCNGDCMRCEHAKVPCSKVGPCELYPNGATVYAFLCGIADKAGYLPYSNTVRDLKAKTTECLEYELSFYTTNDEGRA